MRIFNLSDSLLKGETKFIGCVNTSFAVAFMCNLIYNLE